MNSDTQHSKLTREEVEILCILDAIGRGGGTVAEITARLGLSPSVEPAVEIAAQRLRAQGLLEPEGSRLMWSEQGRALLRSRVGG